MTKSRLSKEENHYEQHVQKRIQFEKKLKQSTPISNCSDINQSDAMINVFKWHLK